MVTKFSEDQRLNAVKLYQEGNTVSKVEQLTGISANYVKNLLKKYNIQARPSGFQEGNISRTNKPHTEKTKNKISESHKLSGHKPSDEAIAKGQPLTIKVRWENHVKDPVNHLIKNYQQGAKSRNLSFGLLREEFEKLIFQDCYYCGSVPALCIINNSTLICNGVDRVDNSLGYIKENCVPACKICNVMKSSKDRDDFIDHCRKVALRFKNE